MVKNIKKKYAFTVVEVLLTLAILGFMILMITLNARKQIPDVDKAHYKKAYLVIEQTVANLINDEQLYPDLFSGFKFTDRAVTEFGEVIGDDPYEKFRDAFKYVVDPLKDDIPCPCAAAGQCTCFMTDDGVVYGIPDSDFDSINVVDNLYKIDGTTVEKFLPITIYTNWKKTSSDNAYDLDATYVGVQYNGNIRIFHPAECSEADNHRYCKEEEYLMADSIKKGNE